MIRQENNNFLLGSDTQQADTRIWSVAFTGVRKVTSIFSPVMLPHFRKCWSFFLKIASAILPAAVALFLVQHYFDTSIKSFCPAYDIDQYYYVREAKTFAAAGFDSGYYGSNGLTAKIGRFGPHGPAYALLYGGLAYWFGGWQDWLSPALNMLFLTAALLVVAWRLSTARHFALACLLVIFSPALIYLPLAYQDALHYGIGLLLALGLASLVVTPEDRPPSREKVYFVLFAVFLAALIRPTWAMLFPAVMFCASPGRFRDVPVGLFWGICLLVVAFVGFSLTASPWDVQAGPSLLLSLLHGDMNPLLSRLLPNLKSLGNFVDNRQHTLNLLIMLGGTLLAMFPRVALSPLQWRRLSAIHLCNMYFPFLIYIVIYNGSGYQLTRLLSAHFLAGLALAVAVAPPRRASFILAPIFVACLAILPATLARYSLFVRPAYDDYLEFGSRIKHLAKEIDPILQLTQKASSPWLRTLIVMDGDIIEPALAAPPEYGIQVYFKSENLRKPFLAGFALLQPADGEIARQTTPLTPVAQTSHGILFRNDAAFGFAPRQEEKESKPGTF